MVTAYPILRQHMEERGISLKELADVAGTNIISISLKMCGIKRWKLTEVVKICCFFNTHDGERLFRKGSVRFVRKYYNIQTDKSQ